MNVGEHGDVGNGGHGQVHLGRTCQGLAEEGGSLGQELIIVRGTESKTSQQYFIPCYTLATRRSDGHQRLIVQVELGKEARPEEDVSPAREASPRISPKHTHRSDSR